MTTTSAIAPDPELSVVICTLNEAQSIGPVLREVRQVLEGLSFELIVVDDSDDDATATVVEAHAATDDRIRLLHRRGERGLAGAAIAGWTAARGDLLAIMDGDGQHETSLLPKLVAALRQSRGDFAVASRYVNGGASGLGARRHLMSRAATRFTRLCMGVAVSDPMSGFFVFRRSWFTAFRERLSGVGFKILVDLLTSGTRRPKVVELEAALRSRIAGRSKLDARVVVELMALLVEKRTAGLVPARFTLFACVGFSGIAVNLAALAAFRLDAYTTFWLAQAMAILVAMVWNFALNNVLTFRERRLKGFAFATGLAVFCLSCLGGAAISDLLASLLQAGGLHWAAASLCGTMTAAVWNYWSTARSAWTPHRLAVLGRLERLKTWVKPGVTLP